MYPLNVSLPSPLIGFAVANDEIEHAELTARGYQPALVAAPQETPDQVASTAGTPDGAASKRKYTRKEQA